MDNNTDKYELYKSFLQQWKVKNQTKYMTYLVSEAVSWVCMLFVIVLGLVTMKEGGSTGIFIFVCFFFILAIVAGVVGFIIKLERKKEWKTFFHNH